MLCVTNYKSIFTLEKKNIFVKFISQYLLSKNKFQKQEMGLWAYVKTEREKEEQ